MEVPQKKLKIQLPCVSVKSLQSCRLCDRMDCSPTRLFCPWDSPGKNTGVGCHALIQEIFLTQRLNSGLLRCRQILYHLNQQGSSFILLPPTYPQPSSSSDLGQCKLNTRMKQIRGREKAPRRTLLCSFHLFQSSLMKSELTETRKIALVHLKVYLTYCWKYIIYDNIQIH